MKRKIISLLLVVVLVTTMSIPVFAKSYTDYAAYKGDMVEVNARCGGNSCSASTNTFSGTYAVSVSIAIHIDEEPDTVDCYVGTQPTRYSASVYHDCWDIIDHIYVQHSAGGEVIYSRTVYPSE